MKNLAQLQLQTQRQKGKTKPMVSARTARGVPQMRKLAKQLTGRQEGGLMDSAINKQLQSAKAGLDEILKNTDRLSQRDIEKAERLAEQFKDVKKPENQDTQAGREAARKLQQKIKSFLDKSIGFTREVMGKRSGGVIRPKPTVKGKVLKPTPIKSRGVGIAIRGFGKAFKKGR